MSRSIQYRASKQIPIAHLINWTLGQKTRIPIDRGCGIVAAVDSKRFVGFQLLYSSLRVSHEVDIVVFDLGLNDQQRAWCDRQHRLVVKSLKDIQAPFDIQDDLWQTWNKPFYIEASGFKNVIWIDSDCIVAKSLRPLFLSLKVSPLFTPDITPSCNPGLYRLLPCNNVRDDGMPYVNAGVVGFKLDRALDKAILTAWKSAVSQAKLNPEIRKEMVWHDQAALKWAIQLNGATSLVKRETDINFLFPAHRPTNSLTEILRVAASLPGTINHFVAGKQKPWDKWNYLAIDFSDVPLHHSDPEASTKPCDLADKLVIFVMHTDKTLLDRVHPRNFIRKINLNELELGDLSANCLCENRIYISNLHDTPHEYIGFASARWNYKYPHVLPLEDLYMLEPKLHPRKIFVASKTSDDWFYSSEHYHAGIGDIIYDLAEYMGIKVHHRPSFWSNNYICHRDVFNEFIIFWRKAFHYLYDRFNTDPPIGIGTGESPALKVAYLLERITTAYFAQADLEIEQIRSNKAYYY